MAEYKKRPSPQARALKKRLIVLSCTVAAIIIITLFIYFLPPQQFLFAYSIPKRETGEMRVHFLDVGEGDCTILEFPSGDAFVIDAGDGATKNQNNLVCYLKGLCPASLSFIITHADGDHYGGFTGLFELFEVKSVYLPVIAEESNDYARLLAEIENEGCNVQTLTRYFAIADDFGAYMVCLSPYSQDETDKNEASAVLYFHYAGVDGVLCGDISSVRERRLVREYNTDNSIFNSGEYKVDLNQITLLKAAHHGSADSTSLEWTNLLKPEVAVLSMGRGNSYNHPRKLALENLSASKIYRTDELTNIMMKIKDGAYEIITNFIA